MLRNTLYDNQIKALKSGDKTELETLRYILAQIKNKEIEKKADLTDGETLAVLRKITRELKESIESFEKGDRGDLAAATHKQLQIIIKYLPPEISDGELKKEINQIVARNKELFETNRRAIIGLCMKELRDKADPGRIISILNSL